MNVIPTTDPRLVARKTNAERTRQFLSQLKLAEPIPFYAINIRKPTFIRHDGSDWVSEPLRAQLTQAEFECFGTIQFRGVSSVEFVHVTGAVKVNYYLRSRHWYLLTYFSDGYAVLTSRRKTENVNTTAIVADTFDAAIELHQQAIADICQRRQCEPMYWDDQQSVIDLWWMFTRFHPETSLIKWAWFAFCFVATWLWMS